MSSQLRPAVPAINWQRQILHMRSTVIERFSMMMLSIVQALELSGDFHTGAAKVYEGLMHLKGSTPTKSAADMASELATKASQRLEVKQALNGPADLDF